MFVRFTLYIQFDVAHILSLLVSTKLLCWYFGPVTKTLKHIIILVFSTHCTELVYSLDLGHSIRLTNFCTVDSQKFPFCRDQDISPKGSRTGTILFWLFHFQDYTQKGKCGIFTNSTVTNTAAQCRIQRQNFKIQSERYLSGQIRR